MLITVPLDVDRTDYKKFAKKLPTAVSMEKSNNNNKRKCFITDFESTPNVWFLIISAWRHWKMFSPWHRKSK